MLEKILSNTRIVAASLGIAAGLYGFATTKDKYYLQNPINDKPAYCEGKNNEPRCENAKTYPIFVVEFK